MPSCPSTTAVVAVSFMIFKFRDGILNTRLDAIKIDRLEPVDSMGFDSEPVRLKEHVGEILASSSGTPYPLNTSTTKSPIVFQST
jgi:hypothetical protein